MSAKFTGARLGWYVPSASWVPSGGFSVLTNCGQFGSFSWWPLPLRSKTKLYCSAMSRIGNVVLRHQRQVAVGPADLQQTGRAPA